MLSMKLGKQYLGLKSNQWMRKKEVSFMSQVYQWTCGGYLGGYPCHPNGKKEPFKTLHICKIIQYYSITVSITDFWLNNCEVTPEACSETDSPILA